MLLLSVGLEVQSGGADDRLAIKSLEDRFVEPDIDFRYQLLVLSLYLRGERDNGLSFDHPWNAPYSVLEKLSNDLGI